MICQWIGPPWGSPGGGSALQGLSETELGGGEKLRLTTGALIDFCHQSGTGVREAFDSKLTRRLSYTSLG